MSKRNRWSHTAGTKPHTVTVYERDLGTGPST
jgi:hypothetical protein